MKLLSLRAIKGRNIYAHFPVIRMTLDLEDLTDTPTCDIPDFNQKLIKLLPGIAKHACSKGYPGGFMERLEKGTYLAHVIEHTAIELQNQMGYNVSFGKARWDSGKSTYSCVFSYISEYAGIEAAKFAFQLVLDIIQSNTLPDIEKTVREIREEADRCSLGPSTTAIIEAARKLEIPVIPLNRGSLLQIGHGKNSQFIQATLTPGTSCISADISCDKELTKKLLRFNHIPVPEGGVCKSVDEALNLAEEIGFPVVIKPVDGNQGKGVSLNITGEKELIPAFNAAREFDSDVVVEKFIRGKQYRVLVVKGEVVAVSRRIAANVTGDGSSTIMDLIYQENKNPLRGDDHNRPLSRIKVDEVVKMVLKKQGFSISSVPDPGQTVWLRENDNISTGGQAIDVTDEIHPELKQICGQAAEVVGVEVAGIDLTVEDISLPLSESNATIIEINSAPGIRMHHYPAAGKPRNVAAEILKRLYPDPDAIRIPIVSITGTNGKTTTTRMIRSILTKAGHTVGMTSTDGVFVGEKNLEKGDNTGPLSAEMVLRNKAVTAAVLETARGGMIRKGLAYDLADVGVVTNISDDHLGMDGIEDTDGLAKAKALVIEAVRKNGYVVLNADDKYCSFMMSRAKGRIILFSTNKENPLLQHHLQKEGEAVFVSNNIICTAKGKEVAPLIKVEAIPATRNGLLQHNVQNALAAIGASMGLRVKESVIKKALSEFDANEENSPGRFNHYLIKGVNVVLDYGHNKDGYHAVAGAVARVAKGNKIGVIGLAGDREDQMVRDTGKVAATYFNRIILKEDKDLRGREAGEISRLLLEGITSGPNSSVFTEYVPDEAEALEKALSYASPGDWVVAFYEKFEKVRDVVLNAGGIPATNETRIPEEYINARVEANSAG